MPAGLRVPIPRLPRLAASEQLRRLRRGTRKSVEGGASDPARRVKAGRLKSSGDSLRLDEAGYRESAETWRCAGKSLTLPRRTGIRLSAHSRDGCDGPTATRSFPGLRIVLDLLVPFAVES